MDFHVEKRNLNTMMPNLMKKDKYNLEKQKTNHRLNISDYFLIKKKRKSKKHTELMNLYEKNIINKDTFHRRSSFNYRPQIRKVLLKEYKEQIKMEKKYRKIKLTNNLSDSIEDESGEEDENIGLEIYISSESIFILIFDILITFFTFYSLLFIPLNRAERKNYYTKEKNIYAIFNIITEILYILDFLISFFRSFYNYEYKKITETKKIIIHYLENDFFTNLLEAIPSYVVCEKFCCKNIGINMELSGFEITMTIFLMLKSLKIFKVLETDRNRAFEILHEKISENFIFEKIFNIFTYFFKIFSFFHVLICIHIFLGWQAYPNWMLHINIMDETLITKYISSFYFIIETMTTVGYGDIICISSIERFFQLILLSMGIVSYSFIVTKFGNYVMKKSNEEIELDKKNNELEQIRIQYPLMPYKLYMKIQEYFSKKLKKVNNNNEIRNLVNNLPDKLRNDLLLVIYQDEINHFFMFKGCKNTDFIIQVCAAFIQTTCEKETILMQEGKKVENIIFVKDGRLILEAAINLSNPAVSYEKYFRHNFKDINMKTYQKMRNSLSGTNSAIDVKQLENTNYLSYLEEKLLDKNKIGKKGNSFFDATRNSVSFQVDNESEKEEEKSDISKEGNNYKYLKILDIRKNEHFGDIYMFLDKPAPLTLKVKSKNAKIFILKKKEAMMINDIHHNIVNRIKEKSFKNLMSIKNKTIQILKKCAMDKLSKMKRTQLQNTSWFNEKSRNNIMNDITNFLNNSINLLEKESLTPNSPLDATKRKSFINEYINARTPSRKVNNLDIKDNKDYNFQALKTPSANNNNFKLKKKLGGFRHSNPTEFNSISSKNNLLSIHYEPKILKNKLSTKSLSLNNQNSKFLKMKILNMDKANKSNNNIKTKRFFSKKTLSNNNKKVTFKSDYQETESLSKELKNSSLEAYSEISSQITKEEEKINTINDIYTEGNSEIRRKIKNSVQKEKILKLCKQQGKMIELYEQQINEKSKSKSNFSSNDNEEEVDLQKISDLNNIIYNKILEYLDTEAETDFETDKKGKNKIKYSTEKIISFSIKSSYSNLNNLTKGKIIINNNYKIDIKNLVQNYVKEKNKNSSNSIDYLVKKYFDDYKEPDQITFHNDSPKKKKKVKFNIPQSSRTLKVQKVKTVTSQFIPQNQNQNKIKKTITNKSKPYKNFKNMDIDDKFSKLKLKNKKALSSKFLQRENNLENSQNSSANAFTKFINSIFSKLKGKED